MARLGHRQSGRRKRRDWSGCTGWPDPGPEQVAGGVTGWPGGPGLSGDWLAARM